MSGSVTVIAYHGIGSVPRPLDPGEGDYWVTTDSFLRTLDLVEGRADVRLTFDDGNISDAEVAAPALARRGLVGEFFLCAGRLGAPHFVSAAAAREMRAAGMIIGSHGMRHRPWRGLRGAELHEEIVDAGRALEDAVGAPVTRAACPFGSYGRTCLSALRKAGFTRVYTTDPGRADPSAWLQQRETLRAGDDPRIVLSWLEGAEPWLERAKRATKRAIKRWR